MRNVLTILTCMLGLALIMPPLAMAESKVDIPSVTETVTDAEPDAVIAALRTPIIDGNLPSAFTDAAFVKPSTSSVSAETSVGTVTYSLTYQPKTKAEPSPAGSPLAGAGGPEQIYNLSSLHYIVFDHPLDAMALEQFDDIFRSAIGDQATNAEVKTVTVHETTAYRISIQTETNGIPLDIEWLAVPVGPVAVIGMTMTGGESIDMESLRADAESLTLAGIAHLGSVVEHRSTPAG